MTEKEKSRKQTEEEIAIILKAISKSKTVLKATFGKLWELMHKEPYISRKRLLIKTEDGKKDRDAIIKSNGKRMRSMIHSACLSASGIVLDNPQDYEGEIRLDDAVTDEYISKYSEQFSDMAEAFIIAAILSGNEKEDDVFKQMLIYKDNPRVAPVFKDVSASTISAIILPLLASKGRGNYISPFANFDRLIKQTIHTAYSDAKIIEMGENGFQWYRCFRNSNYDCPACDDVCAVPHRMAEIVLPVHPHCVCGMYPITENEL